MRAQPIIHKRSLRLYVNAGMSFPVCYAGAKLLDTDKARLPTVAEDEYVTCQKCRRIIGRTRHGAAAIGSRVNW